MTVVVSGSPDRSRIVKKQRTENISEKSLNGVIIVYASGAQIRQLLSAISHEKQLSLFQQQRKCEAAVQVCSADTCHYLQAIRTGRCPASGVR